ncbi:hypothetical protein [uncultured Cocleimonas sp.]|uniref:hypothetical protein n=1 Tax=uncultured Cocleimonas sp. TaxID=1051587 RepID=UPI002613A2AF|nr:hypothetical protein [uncultured Cocleimonas sp.]
MEIELLIKNLESSNHTALDEILDNRDQPAFDNKWVSAYELLGEDEALEKEENIFKKLSVASNNHEICSYIIDDFRLIQTAGNKLDTHNLIGLFKPLIASF